MPELNVSASGSGILKDFFVILLGAMMGAVLVYVWDMTGGKLLANPAFDTVLPGGGVVTG